jgi:hypothetical protein
MSFEVRSNAILDLTACLLGWSWELILILGLVAGSEDSLLPVLPPSLLF